jgi:DNA-binding response OmpR family regulator
MPTAKQRVLVVDDERFFREAIREVLEGAGFEVVTAANGAEALEKAADEPFGVAVLDIQLPGMSGLEVLELLRQKNERLRVIILSAHTEQEIVLEALRLGACDYIAKPLHDEELVLAVRRAWQSYSEADAYARLRGRLDALDARLRELVSAAADPGASADPAALAHRLADAAAAVLGAGKTSLLLADPTSGDLRLVAAIGRDPGPEAYAPVAPGSAVAGAVFERGEAIAVADAMGEPRLAGRVSPERYDSASFMAAPVPGVERPVGVLCATDRADDTPFGPTDLALLRILAAAAGRLLAWPAPAAEPAAPEPVAEAEIAPEEGEQPLDPDAELARRVCDAVSAEVEPARIVAATLRAVAEVLGAAPVALYLVDPAADALVCEGQADGGVCADRDRLPTGRGLTGAVLATGTLVAAASPERDARFDRDVDTPDGTPRPLLCVPVRFRGKGLGVLRAFLPESREPSARSGEVLCAAVSAAVRNVFLYRSLVESIEEVARARRDVKAR